jgi:hypothetical protein
MSDNDLQTSPDVTPLLAAGGSKGEILPAPPENGIIERWRSKVEKLFETFKRTGRTSMLLLSSNWQIVRIAITEENIDLTRYTTLDSLQQFRTLHQRAGQRLIEARARLAVAEEYARLLEELSIQDGWAQEIAYLRSETPPAGAPEYPVFVRCKALRPFTRYYQRPYSDAYARWWLVREGFPLEVAALEVVADGAGAIVDIPQPMFESLKVEGLVALAKPGTPLQLSTGKLLEGGN